MRDMIRAVFLQWNLGRAGNGGRGEGEKEKSGRRNHAEIETERLGSLSHLVPIVRQRLTGWEWLFPFIDTSKDGKTSLQEHEALQEYKQQHPDWQKSLKAQVKE